ncbi:MAG TPA: YdeI/OmpD-associated family protein [Candidatus Saccharibacteria bacterium]|nr:YdeI/OmpD-associated family protein [Candidatus Saccharibacteria bacterium]
MAKTIASGTAHSVPKDLREALLADSSALEQWQTLTPLARNEWICWVVTVKQASTRQNHIERTISELKEGQRRPCCWMGCIHRKDKEISPSVKGILSRRK